MKASLRCNKESKKKTVRQRNDQRVRLLPALFAIGGGCGMFAGPATALELGELQVHSVLGQPLRASVAYALQPNEQIHDYCIYLKPGMSASGLPGVSNAAITVRNGAIRLAGQAPVREPLLSLQLTVDCPYSAHLSRDYSVFIDLQLPAQQQVAVAAAPASTRDPVTVRTSSPQRTVAATPSTPRASIPSSNSYRVQPGDSLSGIASRISGRTVGIWPAVDALFAANPDAFINNDRDLLRAGALLAIPDSIVAMQGSDAGQVATVQQAATSAAASVTETAAPAVDASTPDAAGVPVDDGAAAASAQASESVAAPRTTPRPGDVTLESDSPFVSPIASTIEAGTASSREIDAPRTGLPQTVIDDASSASTEPAVRNNPGSTSGSWSWLAWLGGSGIALIIALLLFGRRLKDRFSGGSASAGAQARRRTDSGNIDKNIDDTDVSPALGLPHQGTAPVARMVTLDADLEDGAGLQYGDDMDIAQDFGFSGASDQQSALDMDLTGAFDDAAGDRSTDVRSTDVLAARRTEDSGILVTETPPQHEDTSEYDLSMIVDATRQPPVDTEGTTKDLRAIEVETEEDDTVSDNYSLSDNIGDNIDYNILEQDYEDELSATQALNAEIAKAAQALSKQFGKNEMGDTLADTMNEASEVTVDMSFVQSMEDETTQLPHAGDGDSSDDVTAAMPAAISRSRADEDTTQLDVSSTSTSLDDTANEDITQEVYAAENDATVEVEIESATIDTRKIRAS